MIRRASGYACTTDAVVGVTFTVRFDPLPPSTIWFVGTSPAFDVNTLNTRFDAAVSASPIVNGNAAVAVFTTVTWLLIAPIVGHVGDGNFHCSLVCDVDNADEMARGEEFMHRLVERAQAMGGTCTGEHGIGQGKQKYLQAELGSEALDAMRALKKALDPQNIFNPGKIVPAA